LVWELVRSANNEPDERNQFPICTKRSYFNDPKKAGLLRGIDPAAVAEIEALQPYHAPGGFHEHPLFALNKLTNINKHRRVLLAAFHPFLMSDPTHANVPNYTGFRLRTPLADQQAQAAISRAEAKVEPYGVVFIVFNEADIKRVEFSNALGTMGQYISTTVVPQLERFF
jgi:hypothetical protein